MRACRILVLVLSASGMALGSGCGRQSDDRGANAATGSAGVMDAAAEYGRIHATIDPEFFKMVRAVGESSDLSDGVAQALGARQSLLKALVNATRLPSGSNNSVSAAVGTASAGPALQLSQALDLAHALRVDAMRQAFNGDAAQAAERLCAIARLSRHVGAANTVPAKIAGLQCIELLTRTSDDFTDRNLYDARARQLLLAEMKRYDAADPLESRAAVHAMAQQIASDLHAVLGENETLLAAWNTLDEPAREQARQEAQAICTQAAEIWLDRGAGRNIATIVSQARSPIVRDLLRSLLDLHRRSMSCRTGVQATIANLTD